MRNSKLEAMISEIMETCEEDMAFYSGHSLEDQEEWDEDEKLVSRLKEVIKMYIK